MGLIVFHKPDNMKAFTVVLSILVARVSGNVVSQQSFNGQVRSATHHLNPSFGGGASRLQASGATGFPSANSGFHGGSSGFLSGSFWIPRKDSGIPRTNSGIPGWLPEGSSCLPGNY